MERDTVAENRKVINLRKKPGRHTSHGTRKQLQKLWFSWLSTFLFSVFPSSTSIILPFCPFQPHLFRCFAFCPVFIRDTTRTQKEQQMIDISKENSLNDRGSPPFHIPQTPDPNFLCNISYITVSGCPH